MEHFIKSESLAEKDRSLKSSIKAKLENNGQARAAPFSLNGVVNIQNASNVHLGHNMVIEAGASHSTLKSLNKPPEHKIQLNPSIQELMNSEEEVNRNQHFVTVSGHIGSDWRYLGRELGSFSNSQMDQLEEPFKANLQPFEEVIYQLLLKWEDQSKITPTVGTLAKALWKCNMHSALNSLLELNKLNMK